jgi:hypothetical protein
MKYEEAEKKCIIAEHIDRLSGRALTTFSSLISSFFFFFFLRQTIFYWNKRRDDQQAEVGLHKSLV